MKFSIGDVLVGRNSSDYNYSVFCKKYGVEAKVMNVDAHTYELRVIKTSQRGDDGYQMRLPKYSVEEHLGLKRTLTLDEAFESYLKGEISEKEYMERRERG